MIQLSVFLDFFHLFYPSLCMACGTTLMRQERVICTFCEYELPRTDFHRNPGNPLDQVFWGRAPVFRTAAMYYFHKGGKVQHLVHQLKYKGAKEVGVYIGVKMGRELLNEKDFRSIDLVIPVPLHPRKLKKRGYNQSEQIALGLSISAGYILDTTSFVRTVATETQTRKSRFARFENVKEIFQVTHREKLMNKHILLVDDVITTGSTLESCANILSQIPGVKVSVAAIAYATD